MLDLIKINIWDTKCIMLKKHLWIAWAQKSTSIAVICLVYNLIKCLLLLALIIGAKMFVTAFRDGGNFFYLCERAVLSFSTEANGEMMRCTILFRRKLYFLGFPNALQNRAALWWFIKKHVSLLPLFQNPLNTDANLPPPLNSLPLHSDTLFSFSASTRWCNQQMELPASPIPFPNSGRKVREHGERGM